MRLQRDLDVITTDYLAEPLSIEDYEEIDLDPEEVNETLGYKNGTLQLVVPTPVAIAFVIVFSGIGKALGSLVALAFGHKASHSGPVLDVIHALGYEPIEWSKNRVIDLVQRYGYAGLAVGLSVPGFPDTLSIYAFSVFDLERTKFAVAAFVGSVGRLLIVLLFFKGTLLD